MRGDRAHEDGVAVGGGLGDDVGADVAAGAGLVVHDDRLLHALATTFWPSSRAIVSSGPAGRVGDHEADLLGGIGLGGQAGQRQQGAGADAQRSAGIGSFHGAILAQRLRRQPSKRIDGCVVMVDAEAEAQAPVAAVDDRRPAASGAACTLLGAVDVEGEEVAPRDAAPGGTRLATGSRSRRERARPVEEALLQRERVAVHVARPWCPWTRASPSPR